MSKVWISPSLCRPPPLRWSHHKPQLNVCRKLMCAHRRPARSNEALALPLAEELSAPIGRPDFPRPRAALIIINKAVFRRRIDVVTVKHIAPFVVPGNP